MKKVLLLCLIFLRSVCAHQLSSEQVPISIHFSEDDESTISNILQEAEAFYAKISKELKYTHNIQINLYPNIQSFHEALGLSDAPDWVVAKASSKIIDIVSPSNPGTCHTEASIYQIMKLNMVKAMIFDKFEEVPYWLAYGVGALKAEYGEPMEPNAPVPTLDELEVGNYQEFTRAGCYSASYSFVQYIQETYGWDALISFLSNYESHKEALYKGWIQHLL